MSVKNLTKTEIAAFDEYEALLDNRCEKAIEKAPKCHCTPMELECGEYDEKWWECRHCGHAKDF